MREWALFALLSWTVPTAAAQPIRLHPRNPHYFLFQGKVVAPIGSGEHYGAVINADFNYHRYLATLEAEGMNYTRLFGGSYVEVPAKSFGILRNDLAPAPGRFVAPWARSGGKFDLNRWNPEYFARLHDFLAGASKRGIIVEITLFSSQYGELQWNASALNRANNVNETSAIDWRKLNTLENGNILGHQERYARKIVREANAYSNVIFEIANEPWSDRPVHSDVINPNLPLPARDRFPNSVDLPDDLTMRWQARVAWWIASEEAALPNKHLIAQNYCNFRCAVRQLVPGVSVVNFHYARPEAVSLNYALGKPISYDESGFLGRGDDAYQTEAWKFMLSGGSAFNGLDYSFSPGHEDGTDMEPNGPGGGSPALRRKLRILSEFLLGLPLVDMAPGARPYSLSSSQGDYALYLAGSGPTNLVLRLPAGDYTVKWVDIDSGKVSSAAAAVHHAGRNKTLRTPEFRNGIALRLTRTRPSLRPN